MKNPVVLREVPKKTPSIKEDFLNEAQRSELRKKLTEKYTKLFGLCNPKVVHDEVDHFFSKNIQLNQKNLVELENKIKRVVLKYKSNSNKNENKETQNQKINESQPIFEIIEENQNDCQKGTLKSKLPTDLQNLEEDDWDNVGLYQAYILKQEKELEKKRKLIEQKALRAQLEDQIQNKEKKQKEVKSEHESYVNLEKQQHEGYVKSQEQTLVQKEKEKKDIFDMQTKMIVARNAQLEKEKKIQDDIDNKIMKSIESDLAKQRELQGARAEKKRLEMIRVREENEERKKKKLEQDEKERKEEIELQKLANELSQDLENQRAAELKVKADKIQQMMIVGDSVIKNQKEKTLEEEQKLLKFVEKKNRLIELKDKKIKEKEKENRLKYREILDLQVMEKEDKLKAEREYIREQASLWKQEEEFYNQFNETKAISQKTTVEEYKKLLEQQIHEKEDKKKKTKTDKVPNEEHIKNMLLEQSHNLEMQNNILSKQLK